MYFDIVCVKRGFCLYLLDSAKRQVYASFDVIVRNGSISRYTFDNLCLTPMTFHYWCRYVSGLTLIWLKNHGNKGFFVDEEF